MKLKGIIVPIGTPLDSDERIDEKGLRRLTRYLVDGGVHGLLVNGTMGGFAHLEKSELVRALEIILEEVQGKVPVIANVGETGTKRAIQTAREFEALRPDYLSILSPFYFLMTQQELKDFFQEVSAAVRTPCLIYNNPITTKNNLELGTIIELSSMPNIVGIKDSDQDFEKWVRLVDSVRGTEFAVLVGTDTLAAAALIMGCDGVIGGLHNVCPQIAVRLYDAVCTGDLETARSLQQKLNDLFSIFECGSLWGGFEFALQRMGICKKITVRPFGALVDPEFRKRISATLVKHGLLNEAVAFRER
ncbi:MAG TPA: dihydrodipicolinate synthase family protein [Acidobacteriota bacterium]|jgi:4-hydroxy-tetrahydrodipicolinate synthase